MKTKKYTLLALAAFFSLSLASCDALLPKTNRSKQDNDVEQSQSALSSGQSKESNKTSSVHVHTFSNYWVYDDNEHWKESTCEHKGLKSETAQHRFDIEVERRDATFETNGYVISQCSVCGCQRQVDVAKKTHSYSSVYSYDDNSHWKQCLDEGYQNLRSEEEPHDLKLIASSAATYDASGYEVYSCRKCEYVKTVETPILAHNYSNDWSHDENNHWRVCIDEGYQDLTSDFAVHEYVVVESQGATYEQPGYTVYRCSVCGYSCTENINQLEHKFNNTWSWDDTGHWRACRDAGYENLRADYGDHTYEVYSYTPATFDSPSITVYACSVCGHQKTVTGDDQSSHAYSSDWTSDDNGHWHQCTDAGYEDLISDYAEHKWVFHHSGEATFESAPYDEWICEVCGRLFGIATGDPLPHNYSSEWTYDEYYHWHACTDEGYDLVNDKNEHDYVLIEHVDATFEHGGYETYECSVCHYVSTQNVVPQLEHNYSSDWSYSTLSHWHSCTDEGYDDLLSEQGSHNLMWEYSGNNKYQTAYCTTCGVELSKDYDMFYIGGPEYDANGLMYFLMDDGTYAVGAAPTFSQIDLVIPSSYNDKPVTRIMAQGFNRTNISSASIPNSISDIGYCAFSSCSGVNSFEIPSSVRTIGRSAFSFNNLNSLTIPSGVVSIGPNAFSYCGYLQSITIPDTVEDLDSTAFNGININEYIVDPNNQFYSSESGVLYNKDKTTLVLCPQSMSGVFIMPDSLSIIDEEAFVSCLGLTAFEVGSDNRYFSSSDGMLFNKNQTKLIRCPAGKTGDVVLPNTVYKYSANAFKNCQYITSVYIPEGLVELWSNAFSGCVSLTSVSLPETIGTIGNGAFSGCQSLKNLDLVSNYNLTEIRDNAFYDSGVEYLTLPESVLYISSLAFQGADHIRGVELESQEFRSDDGILYNREMTELVYYPSAKSGDYLMPSELESMRPYAFYDALLVTSISFPYTFTGMIPAGTFVNCRSLESFDVDVNNSTYSSFGGALYNKNRTSLIAVPAKFSGSFTVPEGVTTIYTEAFAMTDLNLVVLPSTLTSLYNHMFYANYNLTDVVILSNNVVIHDGEVPADSCYNLSHIYLALSSTDDMSYYRTIVAAFGGNVDVYLYSEDNPHSPNMYWHYVDGVPTIWP